MAKQQPPIDSTNVLAGYKSRGTANTTRERMIGSDVGNATYGTSQALTKYDTGVMASVEENLDQTLNELRARRQPLSEKLTNGLSKAGANAAASFLGAVAAPIDWAIAGASDKYDLSSAPIGTALSNWNTEVAENNPHYYSQAEQDAGALSAKNLLSQNFVTDKLLSGLGFMGGAAAAAYVTGKASTGLIGGTARTMAFQMPRVAQLIGGDASLVGRSLGRLAVSAENHVAALEGIAQAVNQGDMAGAQQALRTAANSVKVQSRAQQLIGTLASTHGEAIMEASGSYADVVEKLTREQEQALGRPLTHGEEADIAATAAAVRQAVYLGNVAVLSASNFAQFRSLLSRGYGDLLERQSTGLWKPTLVGDAYQLNAPKWYARLAHSATETLQNSLPEALEEGAQTLLQKTGEDVATDLMSQLGQRRSRLGHELNQDAAAEVRRQVTSFWETTKAYGRHVGPTLGAQLQQKEMQESMFLGALIGVVGDAGKTVTGLVSKDGEGAKQKKAAQDAVDYLNQYGRQSKLAQSSRELVRQISYEMDAEAATQNQDPVGFEEARRGQLRSMVSHAKRTDQLDTLKADLTHWHNIAKREETEGPGEGEAPLSADSFQRLLGEVDELATIHDQVQLAYGRLPAQSREDAYMHAAGSRQRTQRFEGLVRQVKEDTGFDVKELLADYRLSQAPSAAQITQALDSFEQRSASGLDPLLRQHLEGAIQEAAKLRLLNSEDSKNLLALQETSLGRRRETLYAKLAERPALMPEYQRLRRGGKLAAPAPSAGPGVVAGLVNKADQLITGFNDWLGTSPAATTTTTTDESAPAAAAAGNAQASAPAADPATAAAGPAAGPGTPAAPAADSGAGAADSGAAPAGADPDAGLTVADPAALADAAARASGVSTEQALVADLLASTDQTTRRMDEGTPDTERPADPDTEAADSIEDTGADADVYYDSVSTEQAEQSLRLQQADAQDALGGAPAPTLPLAPSVQLSLPLNNIANAQLIGQINSGLASVSLLPRPVIKNAQGQECFTLAITGPSGRTELAVPVMAMQQSAGFGDIQAVHQAMVQGIKPGEAALQVSITVEAAPASASGQWARNLESPFEGMLYDRDQAVIVHVTRTDGQLALTPVWGTMSEERQAAVDSLLAGNPTAGHVLVSSVLRQNGQPAILPLRTGTRLSRTQEAFQGLPVNSTGEAALNYLSALLSGEGFAVRVQGQELIMGNQRYNFDDTQLNAARFDLDRALQPLGPVNAVSEQAEAPTDNEALNQLVQQGTPANGAAGIPFSQQITSSADALSAQAQSGAPFLRSAVNWSPQTSQLQLHIGGVQAAALQELPTPPNVPTEQEQADTLAPAHEPAGSPAGATLDELRALVYEILPDTISVQEMETVGHALAYEGLSLGAVVGHTMYLESAFATALIARHESYHIAHRYLFNQQEQARAMREAEAHVEPSQEANALLRERLPHLVGASDNTLYAYRCEEWLADQFAYYMQRRGENEQAPVKQTALTRLWEKLLVMFGLIKDPAVQRLFQQLGAGALKGRALQPALRGQAGVALKFIPQARTVTAQHTAVSTALAYYLNARAGEGNSVVDRSGQAAFFNLPGKAQLERAWRSATAADAATAFTDEHLLAAVLQWRKQEDAVPLPQGVEGEALAEWLAAGALYLPDAQTEWTFDEQALPLSNKAYRRLYQDADARAALSGEVLRRVEQLRVRELLDDEAADQAEVDDKADRNYDRGALDAGDGIHNAPARLQLWLSTIVYREPQEDGTSIVKAVDPAAILQRVRTLGTGTASLSEFISKIAAAGSLAEGTRDGAMLNALHQYIQARYGGTSGIMEAVKQGWDGELAPLYHLRSAANQLPLPAVVTLTNPETGETKVLGAQRRPVWTQLISSAYQIMQGLNPRERVRNVTAARKQLTATLAQLQEWKQVGLRYKSAQGAQKQQLRGTLPLRRSVQAQARRLQKSFGAIGLQLPETFYYAALTGEDAVYEQPGLVFYDPERGGKSTQAQGWKQGVEGQARQGLARNLQVLLDFIEHNPQQNPFHPGSLIQSTPGMKQAMVVARNLAQQAADYEELALENTWVNAEGNRQQSHTPPSWAVNTATALEQSRLAPELGSKDALPYLTEREGLSETVRAGVQKAQQAIFAKLGRFGTVLKENFLVKNHLNSRAALTELRFFYDAGLSVLRGTGQEGQTYGALAERDYAVARLTQFQQGLITAAQFEAKNMSLLVQHSEHTQQAWTEVDEDGAPRLSEVGVEVARQTVRQALAHINNTLDELYGDEQGRGAITPEQRIEIFHGEKNVHGAVELPFPTRAEAEAAIFDSPDRAGVPRGLQPLGLPVEGVALRELVEEGVVNEARLREVFEGEIARQQRGLQQELESYGLSAVQLAGIRAQSGATRPQTARRSLKTQAIRPNQVAYQSTPAFLADYAAKTWLFRENYMQLMRGHEGYFKNDVEVTKRGAGLAAFGSDLGEGEANIATLPTVTEQLDPKTLLPTSEGGVQADGTDAQGYVTVNRLLTYLSRLRGITTTELNLIKDRAYGEPLSAEEWQRLRRLADEVTAAPIKNVIYGMLARDGGARGPLYVKTSILPLLPIFTSQRITDQDGNSRWVARPGLERFHAMRVAMEDSRTDEMYHDTAVKAGQSLRSELPVHGEYTALRNVRVPNAMIREQVIVPSGKQEIISGSQLLALLDGDVEASSLVLVNGQEVSVGQLRQSYNALHAQVRAWQSRRAQGLARTALDGENLLWALVREQQREMGADEGTLAYLVQQNGELIHNHNLPMIEGTLMSGMLSFLGKQALRFKAAGAKLTLASSVGMALYEELDEQGNALGLVDPFEERDAAEFSTAGEWVAGSSRHENGQPRYHRRPLKMHNPVMSTADVVVDTASARGRGLVTALSQLVEQAARATNTPGVKAGDLGHLLTQLQLDPRQVTWAGLKQALASRQASAPESFATDPLALMLQRVLGAAPAPVNIGRQVERVDYAEVIISSEFLFRNGLSKEDLMNPQKLSPEAREELLHMLGYRIPTQAHQSMIPMKVVALAPEIMGSVVFAPAGITYLAGSDYDVDALYVKRKAFYTDEGGKVRLYGQAVTPAEQETEYRQALKGDKLYKKVLKRAVQHVLGAAEDTITRLRATGLPNETIAVLQQALRTQHLSLEELLTQQRALLDRAEADFGPMALIEQLAGLSPKSDPTEISSLVRAWAMERHGRTLGEEAGLAKYVAELNETDAALRAKGRTALEIVTRIQRASEPLNALRSLLADFRELGVSERTPQALAAHYLTLASLGLPLSAQESREQGQPTQPALGNQLLDVELALLTNPDLWGPASTPTSIDELKGLSNSMAGFLGLGSREQVYNSEMSLTKQRTSSLSGKDNIGVSAFMNSVISYATKMGLNTPLRVGRTSLGNFAQLQETDVTLSLDTKTDAEGRTTARWVVGGERIRRKSESMSNRMSADTDNAKHQMAYPLNFNEATTPVYMTLLGMGYGENRTILLTNQPIIRALAEHKSRQEGAAIRSGDVRRFSERVEDLHTQMTELLAQEYGVGSPDFIARTKEVARQGGLLASRQKINGQDRWVFHERTTKVGLHEFAAEDLARMLNEKRRGEFFLQLLLSPALPQQLSVDGAVDTSALRALLAEQGLSSPKQLQSLFNYLQQQRAVYQAFTDTERISGELFDLSRVTSLVKGDVRSEQQLDQISEVVAKLREGAVDDYDPKRAFRYLKTPEGRPLSTAGQPLLEHLVETFEGLHKLASENFLRFSPQVAAPINAILEAIEGSKQDKFKLREVLTQHVLTLLASRSAQQLGLLDLDAAQQLLTHPTRNIVTQLREVLAEHPGLVAGNTVLRKLETLLPGQNGALAFGLRLDLAAVSNEELTRLRDDFAALELHGSEQVREFARQLVQYSFVQEGAAGGSFALARILPEHHLAPYSAALRAVAKGDELVSRNEIRARLLVRPDVRQRIQARPRLHEALNRLAGLARTGLDKQELTTPQLRQAAAVALADADALRQQLDTPVFVDDEFVTTLGLYQLSPAITRELDALRDELNKPAPNKAERTQRVEAVRQRQATLQDMLNRELGLVDEDTRLRLDLNPDKESYPPLTLVLALDMLHDQTNPFLRARLVLPAALRNATQGPAVTGAVAEGEDEYSDLLEQAQQGSQGERFSVPTAPAVLVPTRGALGTSLYVEDAIAVSQRAPQLPHLPFAEWRGWLRGRQQALSALGAELADSTVAEAEALGDDELAAYGGLTNGKLLPALLPLRSEAQRQRLEIADGVLTDTFGPELNHLPYPARLVAVDRLLHDQLDMTCGL